MEEIINQILSNEKLVNLAISCAIVLFGVLIAGRVIIHLLRWIARRTKIKFDDKVLKEIEPEIKWLVTVISFNLATEVSNFVAPRLSQLLGNVYFSLYLVIGVSMSWKIADFFIDWYLKRLGGRVDAKKLKAMLPMIHRSAHLVIALFGLNIFLSRFGINLGAMWTALGIGGLAISLGAQDILSDVIAGLTIWLSQPFRIGDRIEIQGLDTWGDVVEIGARTTSIRTRDNRMVIVPNSLIAKDQVINYTYPSTLYRIQTDIGVAYDTDIDEARQIITEAISKVEGVLKNKPIDVLYNEMGDSTMIVRIRWWIKSYEDTRIIHDKVNTVLQASLEKAGIEMPLPASTVEVKMVLERKRSSRKE